MSILEAVEAFIEGMEWDDEVESDSESGYCRLSTKLEVAEQVFDLEVFGDAKGERLVLCLTPPFRALDTRHGECCRLFNFLNDEYLYAGRISLDEGGRIMYKEVHDTDDLEPEPAMLHNMLNSGTIFFKRHIEAVAAVALTGKGFDDLVMEYKRKEALKEARNNRNS